MPQHEPLLIALLLVLSPFAQAQSTESCETATTTTCPVPENIKLNEWPMVMSHDAATGYGMNSDDLKKTPGTTITRDNFLRTQSTGLKGQLEAGTRAFDLRPILKGGEIGFHHAGYRTKKDFAHAMHDVKAWAEDHPDEFVLLKFSHYENIKPATVAEALSSAGIPVASKNETTHNNDAFFCDAWSQARMSNGGHVLAILTKYESYSDWIINDNYDGAPKFMLYHDAGDYVVYKDWGKMYGELHKTMDFVGNKNRTGNELEQTQAHWQTATGTVLQTLVGSNCKTLLACESANGINERVANTVNELGYINLLELDNVNDGDWTEKIYLHFKKRQNILAAGFKCSQKYNPISSWYFQRDSSHQPNFGATEMTTANFEKWLKKNEKGAIAGRDFRSVTKDKCLMNDKWGLLKKGTKLREYYDDPTKAPKGTIIPVAIRTSYGSGTEKVTKVKKVGRSEYALKYYNARCEFRMTCVKS